MTKPTSHERGEFCTTAPRICERCQSRALPESRFCAPHKFEFAKQAGDYASRVSIDNNAPDSEAKAWTVFLDIIGKEVVSIKHLQDIGFTYDY